VKVVEVRKKKKMVQQFLHLEGGLSSDSPGL